MRPLATLAITALLLTNAACDDDNPITPPDGAVADGAGADAGSDALSPDYGGPLANVYPHNPKEDNRKTVKAPVRRITDKAGRLTGKYAEVWNCLNKDGGEQITVNLGVPFTGKLCKREQVATPGKDGSYLHIIPPKEDKDGSDTFAEVMMYYHINQIHDYYADTLKLKHLKDKQMLAIVNLQIWADLLNMWLGITNAMYVPKESSDQLKQLLGVDLTKGRDALIFIQDSPDNPFVKSSDVDTAYDASVIYHEYTHAAIGSQALWSPATDMYGVDPTPRGLNEALADYFAASLLDSPVVGTYALGAMNAQRDLTRDLKCPGHIRGEEHHDGEIASGALWAVRKQLGVKIADQAIWNAVVTFGMTTTYEQASTLILAEVKKAAPTKEAAVKKILKDRGMLSCVRLVAHKDFSGAGSTPQGYPAPMGTTFPDGTPSYLQYKLSVAATTKEITIEYTPSSKEIHVALSPGSAPITYDYTSGSAVGTSKATLKGASASPGNKLVLSGSCIKAGDLVYQFVNKGASAGNITAVKITQSATVTNTTNNFDGC